MSYIFWTVFVPFSQCHLLSKKLYDELFLRNIQTMYLYTNSYSSSDLGGEQQKKFQIKYWPIRINLICCISNKFYYFFINHKQTDKKKCVLGSICPCNPHRTLWWRIEGTDQLCMCSIILKVFIKENNREHFFVWENASGGKFDIDAVQDIPAEFSDRLNIFHFNPLGIWKLKM